MSYKEGCPTEEELWDIARHMPTFWKQLGRVLGIEGYVLDAIELDNANKVFEQSLAMLREWRQGEGSRATYQMLGVALNHQSLSLVDQGDLVRTLCCDGNQAHSRRIPSEVDEEATGTSIGGGPSLNYGMRSEVDQEMRSISRAFSSTCSEVTEQMGSLSINQGVTPNASQVTEENRGFKVPYHREVSTRNASISTEEMGSLSFDGEVQGFPPEIPSVSILLGKPFHKTYQRDRELKALHDLYTSLDPDGTCDDVTIIYITGPPGSGKTQLSRSYSEWYGQRTCSNTSCSTVVATLHAETAESLLQSYQQLTCALGIEVDDDGKHDDVKKKLELYSKTIKRLFQRTRFYNLEWLVVVDNVFASNPLKEYWPLPGNGWGKGHVIVTTQDSHLAPSAHTHSSTLSLSKGMEEDDAIKFLTLISEVDRDDDCVSVARQLNYFPLSLACAAVFVRDMRIERPAANFSWNNYLENLNKYFELLQYSEFTDHNICYPQSMLPAAFCSAIRMAKSSNILQCAFKFLSFCTIQPVPLELVAEAVMKNIGEVLIPDEVKKILARCSLLNYPKHGVRGIEVVAMHQVMKAAFVQMRKESCKIAADAVGTTVDMMDKGNSTETLSTLCDYYHRFRDINEHAISTRILLSPHLQDFINTATNTNHTNNEAFIDGSICFADSLVQVTGGTDHHRVRLLETARVIQQNLQLKNLLACRLLSDLGYTYREAGRLNDVIPVLEEANSLAEQQDGHEWMKQRSHILNILGWTFRETYQLELASAYMQMSVDVTKQAYGNQHAEVIERLCNYGIILNDCWNNKEAIQVMEEAQRITEDTGIDSHSAVRAQVFNYSAKIYLRCFLGLFHSEGLTERANTLLEKSKVFHEKALDIYDHLHGKEHKFYLGTAMTYATVLCYYGETDLALEYCEEALRVYRSSGHLAWPRVATILADIYMKKERYEDAKNLLEQAIQGLDEFGVDMTNPRAWLPHSAFAKALIKTGERERGVEMLERCLKEWQEKGLSPDHYWIVGAQKFLENIDK